MKSTALTFIALLYTLLLSAQGSMKQATEVMFSSVCDGQIGIWDKENAVLNYKASNGVFNMHSDITEITIDGAEPDSTKPESDQNGLTFSLSTKLDIPGLDFKTSADNGDTYTFDCDITCNGYSVKKPVKFIFFYAPRVAESDLNGAPLYPFRLDFSASLNPSDFNLVLADACDEIVLKVQDSLLNRME